MFFRGLGGEGNGKTVFSIFYKEGSMDQITELFAAGDIVRLSDETARYGRYAVVLADTESDIMDGAMAIRGDALLDDAVWVVAISSGHIGQVKCSQLTLVSKLTLRRHR
jgi:hypothetical protein